MSRLVRQLLGEGRPVVIQRDDIVREVVVETDYDLEGTVGTNDQAVPALHVIVGIAVDGHLVSFDQKIEVNEVWRDQLRRDLQDFLSQEATGPWHVDPETLTNEVLAQAEAEIPNQASQ